MTDQSDTSQPTIDQAYETSGNPTQKKPAEASRAKINSDADADDAVAHRDPNDNKGGNEGEATKTSMARGIHGAPAGEETKGYTQEGLDSKELDAEQMGAPGEGKVESAVKRKPGASGYEQGLETDLDKKKEQQAPARKSIQAEKEHNVDVGGVLGQRGGPANPVD